MKSIALIEKNNDGLFSIFTPELDHTIIGIGETVAAAKADFLRSHEEIINSYKESNKELPAELKNLSYEYKYDLASLFDYYSFINLSKFAHIAGINASLMRQYKGGQYISEKQIGKIESTLNRIGNELSSVRLI